MVPNPPTPANAVKALGIKETQDWCKAVKTAAAEVTAALDDNKIDWRDWRHLEPITKGFAEAAQGSAQIAAELKDLDVDEAKVLILDLVETVAACWAVINKVVRNNGVVHK